MVPHFWDKKNRESSPVNKFTIHKKKFYGWRPHCRSNHAPHPRVTCFHTSNKMGADWCSRCYLCTNSLLVVVHLYLFITSNKNIIYIHDVCVHTHNVCMCGPRYHTCMHVYHIIHVKLHVHMYYMYVYMYVRILYIYYILNVYSIMHTYCISRESTTCNQFAEIKL